MIAGPSEILVVADRRNDPEWIAADLLSQAEHDAAAQAMLITNDPDFAAQVEAPVERHLAQLPRAQIARASWQAHGAILIVSDWDEAPALIDRIAPEHLELALGEGGALAERVHHAGAIFLGRHTPEAIGDYIAGPNHVLPTSRSARFASGLGVLDFLKRTSLVRCDAASLTALAPSAIRLAEAEGLEAHALSLSVRLDRMHGGCTENHGRRQRPLADRRPSSRRAHSRPPQPRHRARARRGDLRPPGREPFQAHLRMCRAVPPSSGDRGEPAEHRGPFDGGWWERDDRSAARLVSR